MKQVKKEVADKEAAEWLTVERTKEMAQEPAEKENVTQAGSNAVQPGMELAMHDRRFVVDSVDEAAGTVSYGTAPFRAIPVFQSFDQSASRPSSVYSQRQRRNRKRNLPSCAAS